MFTPDPNPDRLKILSIDQRQSIVPVGKNRLFLGRSIGAGVSARGAEHHEKCN
jgi:hypothetical protein